MNLLFLVVDDEPDVEMLFRQQFRRELKVGRFTMEFVQSASAALQRISDAAGHALLQRTCLLMTQSGNPVGGFSVHSVYCRASENPTLKSPLSREWKKDYANNKSA